LRQIGGWKMALLSRGVTTLLAFCLFLRPSPCFASTEPKLGALEKLFGI
jgi:hypothetical protein